MNRRTFFNVLGLGALLSQLPKLSVPVAEAVPMMALKRHSSLLVSLHTSDPNVGQCLQSNSEVSYAGYARVRVARDDKYWKVLGDDEVGFHAEPVNDIVFPECTASYNEPIRYFGIGIEDDKHVFWSGPLDRKLILTSCDAPVLKHVKITER